MVKTIQLATSALENREKPDIRVLDLGCGTGLLGAKIKSINPSAEITGVDISPGMLDLNRKKGIYAELKLHNLDQPLAWLGNETFDFVFAVGVLEMVHSVPAFLSEVARILRPGGQVFLTLQTLGGKHPFIAPIMVFTNGVPNVTYFFSYGRERAIEMVESTPGLKLEAITEGVGYSMVDYIPTPDPIKRLTLDIPYLYIHAHK